MSERMFVGDLGGGDYRARIAKPGYDASDPDEVEEGLLFDSSWDFAGKIHAAGFANYPVFQSSSNTYDVSFPELPYIPAVFFCDYSQYIGGTFAGQAELKMGGASVMRASCVVHQDKISFTSHPPGGTIIGNDSGIYYVVFRIPMLDVDLSELDTPPTRRMIIGKKGSDYGFYVSRPGFDVVTCSDEQMLFSTDDPPNADIFASYAWRTNTNDSPIEGGSRTYSLVNQGFIPAMIAMGATDSSETMILPLSKMTDSGVPVIDSECSLYWKATQMTIGVSGMDPGKWASGTVIVTNSPVVLP